MNLLEINTETCIQDGICAEVCPSKIIRFERGQYPSVTADNEKACINCGHCVVACRTGSLNHRNMLVQDCPLIQNELLLSPQQGEQFLKARRSVRVYKKKSVSQQEIAQLIDMAKYAPSGRNSQDTEWLVVGQKELLQSFAQMTVDWMAWVVTNAPQKAQAMHLQKVIERWEMGKDIIFRDAPVIIVAHAAKDNLRAPSSCTLALSYLDLAATTMELGCCWAGYFSLAATQFAPLQEALPLPEGHRCYGAMMLGYPLFKYHRLPLRNTPKITWYT